MKLKNYDEMSEAKSTFVGKIISAEDETNDYEQDNGKTVTREQCHIMIEPLDHEISGSTGAYHEWLPVTDQKNSKTGLWVERMESMGINSEDTDEWIGLELEFERTDVNFGTEEKPFIVEDVLLPKAKASKDTKAKTPNKKKTPTKKATETDTDFTELDKRLRGDGMTNAQVLRWAKKEGIDKTELNEHLESFGDSLVQDDDDLWFIE